MLLSLLLLLVRLFLEGRAKDVKSGKPSYVDVGSKQKFRCAAIGGRRPPMEDMAKIRRPKKKLLIHTPRWATNLQKTGAQAKESASPTEAAGAATPRSIQADGVHLEPWEHPKLKTPPAGTASSNGGRSVLRQCQCSFAAFQRPSSIQSYAIALFL